MYDTEKYAKILKDTLSDRRFYHSLCVSQSAIKLAKRYGVDEEKAEVAGLLHDITKETDNAVQLEIIKNNGIELHSFDKKSDKFLHQASGAGMAIKLGIEQIVYLADFISADRDYPDVDVIRKETEKGIEYGLLYGTAYTIKSVAKRQIPLHPLTVEAYNWILDEYFK